MKAFLAIKYYENMQNKDLIERICTAFEKQSIEIFAFARDVQNYGPCSFTGEEVMHMAFEKIKSSNIFIIDASEMSIGIGIEAGVAYSNKIPIYVIAKKGIYVSQSIIGISEKQFFYSEPEELANFKVF